MPIYCYEYHDKIKMNVVHIGKVEDRTSRPLRRKKTSEKPSYENQSVRRACSKIREYVDCGNFAYFCSFTFSARGFDRYDISACRKYITNYFTRSFPECSWLLVPELHEDGAIHFHGFFSHEIEKYLVFGFYSFTKKSHKRVDHYYSKDINEVLGRNDFQLLDSVSARKYYTAYVIKYVSKTLGSVNLAARYFHSRGLFDRKRINELPDADIEALFAFCSVNDLRIHGGKFCNSVTLTRVQYDEFIRDLWLYRVYYSSPFSVISSRGSVQFSML